MAEQEITSLSYSVRGRVVLKHIGQLLIALAVLNAVSLMASLLFGEYSMSIPYAVIVFLLAVSGILFSRIKCPSDIQPNEALVITAFIFLFISFILSFPMMASGLSFQDALFEAVSAITTTGLTTVTNIEDKPLTFVFLRSWMQWVGGLGIVVLSVALLMRPGIAARRLAGFEEKQDIAGSTRLYARKILWIYIVISAAGLFILVVMGMKFFPALVHTLSAVSTGGFSSYHDSLSGIGGKPLQAAVTGLGFMGAISLGLFYKAYKKGPRMLTDDVEIRALFFSALAIFLLLMLIMIFTSGNTPAETAVDAFLLAFSAQTTTGFSTVDVATIGPASKLVLIMSMLTGGSIGSTAGGIKIFRLLILLRVLKLTIIKTHLPEHAVVEPRLSGQRLEEEEIEKAFLVIFLFILVVLLSWFPFVAMGYDPLDSLFEVVSAAGTVGLSTGITGHELPAILKGVLCADMLMGRLEIVAFLVVFYPGTWFGRRLGSP
jgi:trk system potassium uptake protein TrkH